MPVVKAPTKDEAQALLAHDIASRCAVAFQCECRLATFVSIFVDAPGEALISYDFRVLSPGELAPKGWTVYEERAGRAVGRTA